MITRRRFLRSSVIAGAAVALPVEVKNVRMAVQQPPPPTYHQTDRLVELPEWNANDAFG